MRVLDGRNAFAIFLIIILLGVFLYWYFTKPTPQESALTSFFDNIRKGNANEASEFLVDASYGQFLLDSKITDTDDNDLLAGLDKEMGVLEDLAWSYIPLAKGHVFVFQTESLETQKSESNPDIAFVVFKYKFTVKEAFDEPSHPGVLDGTAEFLKVDDKWLIKRAEFKVTVVGLVLRRYWLEYQ